MTGAVNPAETAHMRGVARQIFLGALAECSVEKAFAKNVEYSRGILRIGEDLYQLDLYESIVAVSIGKAAHEMASALSDQVGMHVMGLVAGPRRAGSLVSGFRYYEGGHPTPNEESLRAAEAALRVLHTRAQQALVIFMISGGGSSLIEKPIDSAISLPDLIKTYDVLVHSGAPIAEMNAIRKHLSAVKGGRLAQAGAKAAQQVSILVSDVPENALDSLASGPTMADSSTVEDCYRIAQKHGMAEVFPASVRELFEKRTLEETPKSDDPAFVNARWWTLLSSKTAENAAAALAAPSGFAAEIDNACDDWDYAKAADHLLNRARELRKGVSKVCLISAGEVTVKVRGPAGIGGRNQQFALHCAEKIAGQNICILSAGTDGVDGNSPAAGAVVDGTTFARAQEAGLDVKKALEAFDAYPLFEQLGDAIETGPTGNNVRDLRIVLAW